MTPTPITLNDIQAQLSAKITAYNAKLLLHSALIDSGMNVEVAGPLSHDQVKSISLELIRKGGPAFQIGRQLHQQYS